MPPRYDLKPPSRTMLALEGRGLLDIAGLFAAAPFLATAPRGTPHAVMVLPGLGADDRSTIAIRRFTSMLGYDVHGWGRGRNIRAAKTDLPAIARQVEDLHVRSRLPVSLIGWSRGGMLAREVAREIPHAVRLVITLGSPFNAPHASNVGALWQAITGEKGAVAIDPSRFAHYGRPIPVPATAIYTRSDGVVAWQACLEDESPTAENIEVRTTHLGLGFHAPALWVIADRLAQKIGEWKPFRPGPLVRAFFPSTSRARSSPPA
jgi:pimeloyl-ACP methyl ester carboxylesterase